MFDFAWSEIAMIAAVALVFIGPKDMPTAIRAVTDVIKKARRMASEFQTHVDDMVRDVNLQEVRDQISQIRNFDIRGEIERTVDADGSLRRTFESNPLEPEPRPSFVPPEGAAPAAGEDAAVAEAPGETPEGEEPAPEKPRAAAADYPAFIPPAFAPRPEPDAAPEDMPSFIPPEIARQHHAHPRV
jgi:sec-independent protein translocase protein TatB